MDALKLLANAAAITSLAVALSLLVIIAISRKIGKKVDRRSNCLSTFLFLITLTIAALFSVLAVIV